MHYHIVYGSPPPHRDFSPKEVFVFMEGLIMSFLEKCKQHFMERKIFILPLLVIVIVQFVCLYFNYELILDWTVPAILLIVGLETWIKDRNIWLSVIIFLLALINTINKFRFYFI